MYRVSHQYKYLLFQFIVFNNMLNNIILLIITTIFIIIIYTMVLPIILQFICIFSIIFT